MGLFSGVTKAVGGIVGGVLGSSASNSASKAAASAEKAQLEFDKERYEDWKKVYGPVQDNLSAYYSNLSSDYYETMGLEAFELERNSAMDSLNTYLAQRGISDSGIATQLNAEADLNSATTRAQIRRQAPAQLAEEQMNFLSIGLGSNPANGVSNTLASQATGKRQLANSAASASGQAWSSAISSVGSLVGTGLSTYFGE